MDISAFAGEDGEVVRKIMEAVDKTKGLEGSFTERNYQIRATTAASGQQIVLLHISPTSRDWLSAEVWWSMNHSMRPGTAGVADDRLSAGREANRQVFNSFAKGLSRKETLCFCLRDLTGREAEFVAALGRVAEGLSAA